MIFFYQYILIQNLFLFQTSLIVSMQKSNSRHKYGSQYIFHLHGSAVETSQGKWYLFFSIQIYSKITFISKVINASTIESMQKSNIRHKARMALIVFFICMDLKSRVETSQMIFIFFNTIQKLLLFQM